MGTIDQTETELQPRYAAFWFYRATEARFELEPDDAGAIPIEMVTIFEDHAVNVMLRAAYSTIGFSATVDLILWVVSDDLRKLHALAADLHASAFSAFFELVQIYNGIVANRGVEFGEDVSARSYLSVRFVGAARDSRLPSKSELEQEQKRLLQSEAGLVLNFFDSFGERDGARVMTLEADDPITLMEFDRLLLESGRISGIPDAIVVLGLRLPLEEAISVAL